jgi:hypothetical protein
MPYDVRVRLCSVKELEDVSGGTYQAFEAGVLFHTDREAVEGSIGHLCTHLATLLIAKLEKGGI